LPQLTWFLLSLLASSRRGDNPARRSFGNRFWHRDQPADDALINAPAQRATSRLFGLSRFEIIRSLAAQARRGARLDGGEENQQRPVGLLTRPMLLPIPNKFWRGVSVSDRLFFIAQYEQASTRDDCAQQQFQF